MGKPKHDQSLTHEEIWDDSALVQSWDDAVEEYKLYHSIHAKGENIEDVLREAEAAGLDEQVNDRDGGNMIAEHDAMEAAMGEAVDQTAANSTQARESFAQTKPPAFEGSGATTVPGPTFPAGVMPMPSAVLPHRYYTGLYQGQQQASQPKS